LAHATLFFLNIIEINGTLIKLVQSNTREKYDGIRNDAQELAQNKWARNKFDIKNDPKNSDGHLADMDGIRMQITIFLWIKYGWSKNTVYHVPMFKMGLLRVKRGQSHS